MRSLELSAQISSILQLIWAYTIGWKVMKKFSFLLVFVLSLGLFGSVVAGTNIASQSDLHPLLVDGEKNCSCVNNASFGPGWNPGEIISANFQNKKTINSIELSLGCSIEHGETGSGYIEAKMANGNYEKITTFDNYGYVNSKFAVDLSDSISTSSLRIHLVSGGGVDNNLCLSEIEIQEVSEGESSCLSTKTGTVSSNLDIYMPSLNYQTLFGTQNIWVDFKYSHEENGKLYWSLKDYGENN